MRLKMALRSGPDFAEKKKQTKNRLNECNRPRKNLFKLIEN